MPPRREGNTSNLDSLLLWQNNLIWWVAAVRLLEREKAKIGQQKTLDISLMGQMKAGQFT